MSDTMLLGVLRMSFENAMSTLTARFNYHQRGVQAADEIEKLRAENERLRAALRRIGMPRNKVAFCRDGHEIAVLLARETLEGEP